MRLSNRWSKKTLKNAGTKLFSLPYVFVHCKYRVTLKKIWQNKKINIFFGNVLVALKKTQDFFTILCRLYVYFSDFFHVWKIAGQISWPFQEFKMLYEPYNIKFLQDNTFEDTHSVLHSVCMALTQNKLMLLKSS